VLVKIWESGRKMAPCGPDLPRRALESRIRYQNYREREGFDEVKPRTSQEFRGPSRRGLAASTLATAAASSTSQAARCSTPILRTEEDMEGGLDEQSRDRVDKQSP
jgi:hypothetical protein